MEYVSRCTSHSLIDSINDNEIRDLVTIKSQGKNMEFLKKVLRAFLRMWPIFELYELFSYLKHKNTIDYAVKNNQLKLNLGSGGEEPLEGWLDIDMQVGANILTMRLPEGLKRFSNNSVCHIYTSHFLEHLDYPQSALTFIQECHRILQPGGYLRIVVPGIEKIIRAYVEDDQEFFRVQEQFHPSWCHSKLDHLMYALQQDGEHQYGYDFETLKNLLIQAGFQHITQSDYRQSQVEVLNIDYRSLVDNRGEYLSLYVDASKIPQSQQS